MFELYYYSPLNYANNANFQLVVYLEIPKIGFHAPNSAPKRCSKLHTEHAVHCHSNHTHSLARIWSSWLGMLQRAEELALNTQELEVLQGERPRAVFYVNLCWKQWLTGSHLELFIAKCRHSYAVFACWVNPLTSTCPTSSVHTEPISQGLCQKWHHEAKTLIVNIYIYTPHWLL